MAVTDVEAHRRLDQLEAEIRPNDAPSLAQVVRDGFKEMRAEFEKVHERLDSIDRCLDDDFGPRLKGLQAAVKRIEDGLPQ